MEMKIKFPSGSDFDRLLENVEKKVGVNLLRDAGRKALEVVEADMKQNSGYDKNSPGPHMRDSIRIRSTDVSKSSKYATIVTLRVGISKAHHMKAVAQEFGTNKQIAKPFIRPALDYNVGKVLQVLATEIRIGLENK